MKIVFGIMSAVHSAETVEQLANALAPWPVVIHHDFQQTPSFQVRASNASFVDAPKRTGWAVWGFSEGIVHLLDTCLNQHGADYFQLLSPTCLPVRPLIEFEEHLQASHFDVHIGSVAIESDPNLLMNFGYRAYCAENSPSHKLLRRLRAIYFGRNAGRLDLANLQTQCRPVGDRLSLVQRLAWLVTNMARRGWFSKHPFASGSLIATAGGTWFGCRRDAGQYLVDQVRTKQVEAFFSKMRIADEMMFATLFGSSPFDVGEPNHYVHTFDEANPRWIEVSDLPAIRESRRFFARKFRDDSSDQARREILKSIGYSTTVTRPLHHSETRRSKPGVVLSQSLS